MHGIMLTLPKRYVQLQYDHGTWVKLMELSGFDQVEFDHKTVSPDERIYALVGHATEMTGIPAGELREKFGEYLVPDLLYMYQRLLRPEWKTFDMLEPLSPGTSRRGRSTLRTRRPCSQSPASGPMS